MCRDITVTHAGCQHKIKSKEICEARRQEVKRAARSSCCVLWAPSERSVCKILPETQQSRRPCQVCQRREAERRKNDRKMTEQARAQAREHAQRYARENRDSVALMSEAFQVMPADEFNGYKQPRTREPAAVQTSEPSSSFLQRPRLYERQHPDNNPNQPLPSRGRDRIMDTPTVALDYLNNKKAPPRSFKASDVRKAAPPRLDLNKTLPPNPAPVPVPVPVPGAGRSLTGNDTRAQQPQPTCQSRNQQAVDAEVSPLSPACDDGEPRPDDRFLAALERDRLDDLQRM